MTALTNMVEPRTGRTAEIWVGFTRGDESRTNVAVTWEPTARVGNTAATRIDVEPLKADGSVDGPAQSVPRKDAVTTPATARFQLAPGKNLLRFTSFDTTGDVLDRWPVEVNVPGLNGKLALATPRFFLARSAFELRALQTASDVAPAATRRVRKSDRLLVELEYYTNGPVPELVAELLNQKGDRS